MCRRIKVDLSKFYNDARRSSVVYVDGLDVLYVHQLQDHIAKMFNIVEPFYLLLNGTDYLPPAEDARIVELNERVMVVPGSGFFARTQPTRFIMGKCGCIGRLTVARAQCSLHPTVKEMKSTVVPINELRNDVRHVIMEPLNNAPDVPIIESVDKVEDVPIVETMVNNVPDVSTNESANIVEDVSINESVNDSPSDPTVAAMHSAATASDTMFHSIINISQMDSASESKATDSNLTEDYNMDKTPLKNKRKRVRRKKCKNTPRSESAPVNNWDVAEAEAKKPKLVTSFTIPNSKHIRFSNMDDEEVTSKDNGKLSDTKATLKINQNGGRSSYSHFRPSGNLSTLLALGQSSTPITFDNKRLKGPIIKDNAPNEQIIKDNASMIQETSTKQQSENSSKNKFDSPLDAQKCKELGLMTTKANVADVITFKILKMSSDYTPQISELIVAEVIECSSTTSSYKFKILEGKDQVQAPQGKFDLQMDEDESKSTESDTIVLDWNQLIQPKFLYSV